MYIITQTLIKPARKEKWWGGREIIYPRKEEKTYFSDGLLSGFKAATLFTEQKAREVIAKLSQSYYTDQIEKIERHTRIYGTAPVTIQALYDIVDINDIPEHPIFANASSFCIIPAINRDVQFVYRDGSTEGVVTNFLRQEKLKGNYCAMPHEKVRWRYIPDGTFLKIQKQLGRI